MALASAYFATSWHRFPVRPLVLPIPQPFTYTTKPRGHGPAWRIRSDGCSQDLIPGQPVRSGGPNRTAGRVMMELTRMGFGCYLPGAQLWLEKCRLGSRTSAGAGFEPANVPAYSLLRKSPTGLGEPSSVLSSLFPILVTVSLRRVCCERTRTPCLSSLATARRALT